MKEHVALLIRNKNEFLFVKRSKTKTTLPGIWAFPSGTKEELESIEETGKREAFEELDVKIEIEKILGSYEIKEFEVKLNFIVAKVILGDPRIKERNEIEEIEWLTFKEFFDKYRDEEIGHGLKYLRKNPALWAEYAD